MDLPSTFSLMRTKSPWFVCDADRNSFSWWTAVYSIISSCSRSSFTLLIISNSSSPTAFSDVTLSFVRRFRDGPYETDDGPFRSCCKWLIITSSNSFRVSGLNIWGNLFNTASGLNGKIPHAANLLFLSYLNLVGCRFTRLRSFVEKEDFGITMCFCSSFVMHQSQIIISRASWGKKRNWASWGKRLRVVRQIRRYRKHTNEPNRFYFSIIVMT